MTRCAHFISLALVALILAVESGAAQPVPVDQYLAISLLSAHGGLLVPPVPHGAGGADGLERVRLIASDGQWAEIVRSAEVTIVVGDVGLMKHPTGEVRTIKLPGRRPVDSSIAAALGPAYFVLTIPATGTDYELPITIIDRTDTVSIRLEKFIDAGLLRIDSVPVRSGAYRLDVLRRIWDGRDRARECGSAIRNVTPTRWEDLRADVDAPVSAVESRLPTNGGTVAALRWISRDDAVVAAVEPNMIIRASLADRSVRQVYRDLVSDYKPFPFPYVRLDVDSLGALYVASPHGTAGTLLRSTDEGESFVVEARNTDVRGSDRTLQFSEAGDRVSYEVRDGRVTPAIISARSGIGFIAGSNQPVLRDGRREAELAGLRPTLGERWLNAVAFADGMRGVGVADRTFIGTDDGGRSWREIVCDWPGSLNAVDFDRSGEGVVVGARGTIFWSRDAGRTWTYVPIPEGGNLTAVEIIGPGVALVGTGDGEILRIHAPR